MKLEAWPCSHVHRNRMPLIACERQRACNNAPQVCNRSIADKCLTPSASQVSLGHSNPTHQSSSAQLRIGAQLQESSFQAHFQSLAGAYIPPRIPFSYLPNVYPPFVCNSSDSVYVSAQVGETEAQAAARTANNRRYCTAIGKPLLDSDYLAISTQAYAVSVREHISVRGRTFVR